MKTSISKLVDSTLSSKPENLQAEFQLNPPTERKTIMLERKRLVVLLSAYIYDETEFSKYILSLAEHKYSDVLLLMLASNYEDEANGHLRLFTITSLLTGFGFIIKSQMVYGKTWESAIRSIITTNDTVACPKDVMVPVQLVSKEPLPNHLKKKFTVNLIEYSGFVTKKEVPSKTVFRMLSFWLGVVVILASFFWIGSLIDSTLTGWVGTLFLMILTIAQIAIGYFWFVLLGR